MNQPASAPAHPTAETEQDATLRGRREIRTQIINYLARNGASKLSNISNSVTACTDTIRFHLKALEHAAIVQSNIPAEARSRTTPFYSLTSSSSATTWPPL
jgi:predicted ArsR family transcriptional regulator